ncbi:MAG: S41 family peptidase [Patescibacteria group bacterium]
MSIEHNPKEKKNSAILGYGLALVLAAAAFVSGVQFGQREIPLNDQTAGLYNLFFGQEETVDPSDRPDLSKLWEVWDLLEEKYVTASSTAGVTKEERIEGAIEGLVDTYGDPYTVYLPPEEAAHFNEDISGNFSGVGMEVGLRDGLVTIIAPLPETPAAKAGLLAGDVIVKIDETTTEDMRIDEAVRLIRGEKGTVVILTIFREGEDEFLTIPVTRDTIEIPTVKTEKVDDTFIIALYTFNALSEQKMKDALTDYLQSGSTKLILDLRGNPGGFLQSAVAIGSYFLPAGKVVVTEQSGEGGEEHVFRSRSRQQTSLFSADTFVVLVDNGSASAAEILAGALKDHGVATVIGSVTFGKGSVQELVELDDGASLKVTVARWLTPSGLSISNGGLAPNILINRTPAERLSGADPQKDAALRFLRGEEVTSEAFEDTVTHSGLE